MSFWKEFKEFAIKGNMVDMAVGIIIGAAFNNLLKVFVDKIIMPPLNLLTSDINFENKEMVLREAVVDSQGKTIVDKVAIEYGEFINVMIDFFIISFVVFVVVKMMNKIRRSSEDTEDQKVETPKDIQLLHNLNQLIEEQNKILKNKNL